MRSDEDRDNAGQEERDRQIDSQLRAAILAGGIDTASLDARVRERVARDVADARRIRRGKWIAAMSVAAMLAICLGGYRFLSDRDAALCSDAAADHRDEVVEGQPRKWLTDPAAIDRLAAKRGLRSRSAVALAPPGYRIDRGKLCLLNGRVFLHLVYSDGSHEFSFFLRDRTPQSSAHAAGVVVDKGAEHVAQVESSRFTALVVSDESNAAASQIARFESTIL